MRLTLTCIDGKSVSYEQALGGFNMQPSPCFRCGTCCSRWQAPVTRQEARMIAARLGMEAERFIAEYLRLYPFDPDASLIVHQHGHCAFLTPENGRYICSIHAVKPSACKAWTPSLQRKECRDGLRALASSKPLLTPDELGMALVELETFAKSLQDSVHYSIIRE